MLLIKLNNFEFEMDIRPLVLSFYPGEELVVRDIMSDTSEFSELTDYRILEILQSTEKVDISLIEWSTESGSKLLIKENYPVPQMQIEDGYRLVRKNQLKRDLYLFLSGFENKKLPWGTLTGIRPVKFVTAMINEGLSIPEINKELTEKYYMSEQKQQLCIDTARKEHEIIGRLIGREAFSLYVGVPFCPSTCAYCSFTSFPLEKWRGRVDEYVDCLIKELRVISKHTDGRKLETIYFGGGTPTTLEPPQLMRVFDAVMELFSLSDLKEWTVEAGRPDSITREKLLVMKNYPISRISINPQTMKDETLKLIGRRHSVSQTIESFKLARSLRFDNINMDVIMGLPGESVADVRKSMEEIEKLLPDSLTVHTLAIKRAARLKTNSEEFSYKPGDTQGMLNEAYLAACRMGMKPYYLYRQKNMVGNLENVGYARDDKYGIYNILIMEEIQSIYGAGAGASTKLILPDGSHKRTENVKNAGQYMDRIDEMVERKFVTD